MIVYGLQSKTDRKMKEVIDQIESYTEKKKELEDTSSGYYVSNIQKDLEYIKNQDLELFDIIMEFLHYDKYPNNDIWFWIHMQWFQTSIRCKEIMIWMEELQKSVPNPQPTPLWYDLNYPIRGHLDTQRKCLSTLS